MVDRVRRSIETTRRFLQDQVWEQELSGRPWIEAFALRQLRVGIIVVKGITSGNLALRASAMTYTTLLSLVPLLVVAFTVFRAFGGLPNLESKVETWMLENIMPVHQEAMEAWIGGLLEDIKGGAFSGISVLLLAGGVLGLLSSIESAFNDIWGVHRGRSFFQRLSTYTTLIVSSPILIGVSLSLTASLQSSTLLRGWLDFFPNGDRLLTLLFQFLPVVLTGIALTLLYTIMPHVKVRIRAALPAGLAAAVIWEISKIGFATYLKSATHYNAIYGPLAALPLFFLWVFISWAVVLFGAQLTFAQDAVDDIREEELAGTVSLRERIRVALHLVFEACRRYREERPAPELVEISRSLSLPLRLVRQVAEILTDGGIVDVVQTPKDGGISPARSPERITVYEVVACIVDKGHVPRSGRRDLGVDQILDQVDATLRDRWSDVTIEDCIARGAAVGDLLTLHVQDRPS